MGGSKERKKERKEDLRGKEKGEAMKGDERKRIREKRKRE